MKICRLTLKRILAIPLLLPAMFFGWNYAFQFGYFEDYAGPLFSGSMVYTLLVTRWLLSHPEDWQERQRQQASGAIRHHPRVARRRVFDRPPA